MGRFLSICSYAVLLLSSFLFGSATFAAAAEHVSNSGAIFTLDTSNPRLGLAFRDPDGIIWGSGSQAVKKNQENAVSYCNRLHARLPSVAEFQELAKLLGNNSADGYSVFSTDAVTPVIPNLLTGYYWSSDLGEESDGAYEFSSDDGYIGITSRGHADSVICISL